MSLPSKHRLAFSYTECRTCLKWRQVKATTVELAIQAQYSNGMISYGSLFM